MSESWGPRVVPDLQPPSRVEVVGCWFTILLFGVGFYVAVAVFIAWVLRR